MTFSTLAIALICHIEYARLFSLSFTILLEKKNKNGTLFNVLLNNSDCRFFNSCSNQAYWCFNLTINSEESQAMHYLTQCEGVA